VGDVAEALPRKLGLAYSTVLTTLRILERKGYIRHERNGRAFVYRPVVDRGQVRRSAVKYVVSRFFQDSPELLVLNVLEHEKLDPGELKRLRELIERGE
jgi:predicted transcriptional regulator